MKTKKWFIVNPMQGNFYFVQADDLENSEQEIRRLYPERDLRGANIVQLDPEVEISKEDNRIHIGKKTNFMCLSVI